MLGRVKNHLKMGIVGLPNVGKSSLFNLLTKLEVKAENYPFCTKDPNKAQVPLPDAKWEFLCNIYQPASKVPSYLEVVDIAGLVKGANEGEGLGNAFLSHISAVDGIFHVIRVFEGEDIIHVEGSVDALRDLEIISNELRLKDLQHAKNIFEPMSRQARSDPQKRLELARYEKIVEHLEKGHDIREGDWTAQEVEILNDMLLLTAKPIIYIINMSEQDFVRQKNKWLPKVVQWIKEHSPGAPIIPVCVTFEQKLEALPSKEERDKLCAEMKTKSQIDKIIQTGFQSLSLINFFTCGADEVRAWPIQVGTKAPQAAGTIHTDFEKKFIKAEVMKFDELKELGSEAAVKAAGKYRTEGKGYVVEDADILLIKHNAGGAAKKK
uniref:Obg-like ATPase 1 n=1 Tax=Arcella intermedia TaxID=1963864 RepID=A0A6B2L6G4_9EUKA